MVSNITIPQVVNMRKGRGALPSEVRIDRKTIFGNDVRLKHDTPKDRQQVVQRYAELLSDRLLRDPKFTAQVKALYGRTLACWCAPKMCHGFALGWTAWFLNEPENKDRIPSAEEIYNGAMLVCRAYQHPGQPALV